MSELELRHYSYPAWSFDRERTYKTALANGKPDGFWVSVLGDDDWPSWCKSEEWGLGRLESEHEVTLTESANILRINGPLELNSFHDRFAVEASYSSYHAYRPSRASMDIDWELIKGQFDGIVIAPYLWSQRLRGPGWYYGWDCASGVIWNLTAIESVTRIFSNAPSLVSEAAS